MQHGDSIQCGIGFASIKENQDDLPDESQKLSAKIKKIIDCKEMAN
jgi:hypothetical protein